LTSDDLKFDEPIEVVGSASLAAAGPMVNADDGRRYYLLGVEEWRRDMRGKRIVVTGTLRLRPAQVQTLSPDQPQSHGLPGETLVIDDAQWRPAD
jgi:hypothetical protein